MSRVDLQEAAELPSSGNFTQNASLISQEGKLIAGIELEGVSVIESATTVLELPDANVRDVIVRLAVGSLRRLSLEQLGTGIHQFAPGITALELQAVTPALLNLRDQRVVVG